MDFEVPVRKNYVTELHEVCWVSRMYNKSVLKYFSAEDFH